MKKLFITLIITFFAGAAVVFGLGFFKDTDYIAKARSSVEVNRTWNVAQARYVNETGLTVSVDGHILEEGEIGTTYMSDDMELMLDRTAVTEGFDCSVQLYDNAQVAVFRGNTQIEVAASQAQSMRVNKTEVALAHTPTLQEEGLFLPAQLFTDGFGYSYQWDSQTQTVTMQSADPAAPFLPSYFNYADLGKISSVRDQGSLGTCWAFAALSAAETTLLPEERFDFSEDHMLHHNGFASDLEEGGDYIMALAYLAAWKGPVLEEDDPYGDDETDANLSPVKHVQEVRMVEAKDYETIKEMVFKYGAVESSIYMALLDPYTIDPTYYNYERFSYCYPKETIPNHEIIIIGWDDAYPAENFSVPVAKDGAFICQNSWGSSFGSGGIFYISYEDALIGSGGEVYTKIESSANYDHIYQYDPCGFTGRVGYNKNHAYFANIYTAGGNESLEAVSFYATGPHTSYQIYVQTKEGESEKELLSLPSAIAAKGYFAQAGYYTVSLQEAVPLRAGQDYAVIVEIDTPESSHPIAIEIDADEARPVPVVLEGKRSFISSYGDVWENTQEISACNVCLKAFTNDR